MSLHYWHIDLGRLPSGRRHHAIAQSCVQFNVAACKVAATQQVAMMSMCHTVTADALIQGFVAAGHWHGHLQLCKLELSTCVPARRVPLQRWRHSSWALPAGLAALHNSTAQHSSARACPLASKLGAAAHAVLQLGDGGDTKAEGTRLPARPPPAVSRCLQPHRSGRGWTGGLPRRCLQRLPAPTAPKCLSPGLPLPSHSAQSSAEETQHPPPPAGSHKAL